MKKVPLLLYPKQAQQLLGVGSTKFYELIKLPHFPKARNPLGKRPMFVRQEIEEWAINLLPMIQQE
ncbi:helix-turn-helix transcriptional regulator [Legionella bozemanae]|uniref:helix-turn-helix transcriptional regulator n=1 Tax=Legionella bozemanae TaxID=447 RepID=UPI001040E65F|nr:AlpA family phage regulatory protein [Legionella bozemanae]